MRARNIKPSFFTNEYLAELSLEARLLFISLWCQADREGRLEDRPKRIKVEAFPFDDVDTDALLHEIASATEDGQPAFIHRYVIDGKGFIEICNFKKHQRPHTKEKASTLPGRVKPGKGSAKPGKGDVKHALDPGSPFLDPGSGIPHTEGGSGVARESVCEEKNIDPLSEYPTLAGYYDELCGCILTHHPSAKIPAPTSDTETEWRQALSDLCVQDGFKAHDVVERLTWLFKEDPDPTANLPDWSGWRSKVTAIPHLRKKKDGDNVNWMGRISEAYDHRNNGKMKQLGLGKSVTELDPTRNWGNVNPKEEVES